MNAVTAERTDKKKFQRCAVLKIDLAGRIVNIDSLTEKLLGLPGEELFGREIVEFLDNESYDAVMEVLNRRNRYESFYETTELVFRTRQNQYISYMTIISLNFIGGNPANYQLIINPFGDRVQVYSEMERPDKSEEISAQIFNYLAALNGNIDWEELLHVFLKSDKIILSAVYFAGDKMLDLIAEVTQFENANMEAELYTSATRHLEVVAKQQPLLDYGIEDTDMAEKIDLPELKESCFPLINRNKCWGMLRLLYTGDINQIDIEIKSLSGFLGNALYSFAAGDLKK
jgi:PAS domain S-box-containing protein